MYGDEKRCAKCYEDIYEDDDTVQIDGEIYHRECAEGLLAKNGREYLKGWPDAMDEFLKWLGDDIIMDFLEDETDLYKALGGHTPKFSDWIA